jgi:hypothetical protein
MIVGKTYLLSLIIIRGRFIFEKRGNDTIRAVKSQSDTDFDVKCATIQFHGNNHNSQSYHWIKLKVYIESPNTFSYLGLTFRSIRARKGIAILVNRGCMNFVIYFLLTCELIWLGFFSYKDMAAGFGNFLVRIFNRQQHSFHVWYGLYINVESLWCLETIILSLCRNLLLNKFLS